ncbi:ribonuclease Z [Miltoncostaea marina]|uniref:ribonuclease Z n=1 Tax=Miltoncostaea marina TaxID=2843215 RepID=UPI001C3D34EE|nr:ribonuclease Z [Miltoncostaea marina]
MSRPSSTPGPPRGAALPALDVVFLGTGARSPTPLRAVAATVVIRGGERLLVDCGEGTQRQLMRSVAGLRRLTTILITHGHGDHVLGLPGLLATLSDARREPLAVLGPPGLRALIDGFRVHFGRLAFPMEVREMLPGEEHAGDGYRLVAVATRHGVPSLAWALAEDPLPGHLIDDRLAELGVPAGPARAALARGEEVVLPGGRRVTPSEVTGARRPGRRLVLSGDTRPSADVEAAAAGADLLVHEATFLERDRELAARSGHSTASQAGALAARAGVRMLALVHRSSRYGAGEVLAEARRAFPAAVVPEDLDRISVPSPERGAPRLVPGGGRTRETRDRDP